MDAGARDLTGGPEPGDGRGPPEVGHDPAALVVSGGGDGEPVVGRVEADGRELRRDRGEPLGEPGQPGGVEPDVVDVLGRHHLVDRPGHDVTGQQLVDEPLAGPVAEHRPVAPQRLAEQSPGHGRMIERRRVELEELEVRHRGPGPDRHRHTITGGHQRVGGHREQLAGSPGRQQHVPGPYLHHLTVVGDGGHPYTPAALAQQLQGEGPLVDARRGGVDGCGQCPFDLGAGGGATRMHHPGDTVPALARQFEFARLVLVEPCSPADQPEDPARALVDQHPDGVGVAQAGAGRQGVRVVQVELGLVTRQRGGHPSLGPPGGCHLEVGLRQHPDREAVLGRGLHRGRQPCHAAAQDQEVELGHRSAAATLSISRARPNVAAISSREEPSQRSAGSRVRGSATSA